MLIQKFLDGTITFQDLTTDAFKEELCDLLAKAKNTKEQMVQTVKKAMKFISKLSTGTQTINLVEFYKAGNKKQPLYLLPNFQTILNEATENGELPTVEIDEMFYQYQNIESITDNNAMKELNEAIIDLGTAEGRLEARKRLGALARFLKQQPKAEKGDLLTNGYANIIGWLKTQSGSVFSARAFWFSDVQEWYCDGNYLDGGWVTGHWFWSRNGEA